MTTDITPVKSVTADAKDRAVRTFIQGLAIDVLTALVLAVAPLLLSNDFAFTAAYWIIIGTSASKSVVQSVAAYFMRKFVSPKQ